MAERLAALIPAAGSGERLGKGPKAFVPLGRRPLLAWALDAVQDVVDEVVVAVPAGDEERARAIAHGADVVPGGVTRQETVRRLLERTSCELVVVHDVARPFLARDVRDRVIVATRAMGAASAAIGLRDTIVDAQSGKAVDRDRLRAIQTPQAFARELLARAHADAHRTGAVATDDADLVRRLGHEVALVEGSPWLLKITTPDDLRMAERLAGAWHDAG